MFAIHQELSQALGDWVDSSPWVRRLAGISFLGTLDNQRDCVRTYSRLEHSLAVASSALFLARSLDLEEPLLRTFVASALLHDVGHLPMSHAAEAGFRRTLGVDHHELTHWIICGRGPIGAARSIAESLRHADLDPDLIWTFIEGESGPSDSIVGPLLSAPLNLDTFDAIPRAAGAFALPAVDVGPSIFVRRLGGLGVSQTAIPMADLFWKLKDRVYREVIDRPSNAVYEAIVSEAVACVDGVGALDVLETLDDKALAALLQVPKFDADTLAEIDQRARLHHEKPSVPALERLTRRFHIDTAAPLTPFTPAGTWHLRYRREVVPAYIDVAALPAQVVSVLPESMRGTH